MKTSIRLKRSVTSIIGWFARCHICLLFTSARTNSN